MRSAVVMAGYRNQPERTAEAIDADGWLHTGDIAEIDEDGYVRLVDRKKEIIINAGGKNMSPANIEATLKGSSPLIGQACVIGDGRRFNTALIVLDTDFGPIDEPAKLDAAIRKIPGIVDNGLFLGMAHLVLVGGEGSVREMRRRKREEKKKRFGE